MSASYHPLIPAAVCELAANYGFDVVLADDALRLISDGVFPPPPHPDSLNEALGRAIARITPPWQNLVDDGVTQIVITASCLTTDTLPLFIRRGPADDLTDLNAATLPPRPRPSTSATRQNNDVDPTAPNPSDEEDVFIRCRACGSLVLIEHAVCVHCTAPLPRAAGHRHPASGPRIRLKRQTQAIRDAAAATAAAMELLRLDDDGQPRLNPETFLAHYATWMATLNKAAAALEPLSQLPVPSTDSSPSNTAHRESQRILERARSALATLSRTKTLLQRLNASLDERKDS